MISLNNNSISRILKLLEFDIDKLQKALDAYSDNPVENAKHFMDNTKYDLAPVTKDGIKQQLEETRNAHKQISEEVGKATFVFGLSSRSEPKEDSNKGFIK